MTIPRPGMFALVRNRRGVVAAVQPFDGPGGRLHLGQEIGVRVHFFGKLL